MRGMESNEITSSISHISVALVHVQLINVKK